MNAAGSLYDFFGQGYGCEYHSSDQEQMPIFFPEVSQLPADEYLRTLREPWRVSMD